MQWYQKFRINMYSKEVVVILISLMNINELSVPTPLIKAVVCVTDCSNLYLSLRDKVGLYTSPILVGTHKFRMVEMFSTRICTI